MVKHPGNNGRHFKMLCFDNNDRVKVLEAVQVKRGPYKKHRR